jgi:plastocyanin
MRNFALGSVLTFSLAMWGCSNSGYSSGTAGSVTAPTPIPADGVVSIDVVAINGAQSFSPNPATLSAGQLVVWRNVNSTTHRIVLNDRSVDTGDLAPGASTQPMAISATGGQYHCSIHPEMTGSINQATAVPAPASPY